MSPIDHKYDATTCPVGITDKQAYYDLKKFLKTGNYKYIRTPIVAEKKPNRNDPCPCSSGLKYKKCCGK